MIRTNFSILLVAIISLVALNNVHAASDGIVVWKLQANKGVEDSDVNLISNYIANQVATLSGRQVISEADIRTILKGEETRQNCGAESTSCIVEISNALGVPEAVSGDIGKIGSFWMLNLRRISVQKAEVIARSSRNIEGSIDKMIRALPGAVAELFGTQAGETLKAAEVLMFATGKLFVKAYHKQTGNILKGAVYVKGIKIGETDETIALDPGSYDIEVKYEDKKPVKKHIKISSKKEMRIRAEFSWALGRPRTGEHLKIDPELEPGLPLKPDEKSEKRPDYLPGIFTGVASVLALGFGIFLELEAQDHYDNATNYVEVSSSYKKERDEGYRTRVGGGVLMGLGAAGTLASIALFIWVPEKDVVVAPATDGENVSLLTKFHF